ncbi:hypothetical protein LAZ67_23001369 [Cordylochernes scorpioides]|uniref:Copia protein n=1 Tax=Cordylochernes scorpioides TaxID=51811 RepID=A0ABY6LQM2_9ARAC|nr:hypothetical protein LAZ67_23001369 [Cordylochernes scorpioides]
MWRSHKKQPVIALSSTEAEFIAAADACKEVSYIRSLLEELITNIFDINLYVDNQSTIKIIKSGQFTTKTKHIDVKYHFVKDQAQKFNLIYCPTEHQIADILTKPLARPKRHSWAKGEISKQRFHYEASGRQEGMGRGDLWQERVYLLSERPADWDWNED